MALPMLVCFTDLSLFIFKAGIVFTKVYTFYVYNLAWGCLKNGKNGGDPFRVLYRFCFSMKIFPMCNGFSYLRCTFKLVILFVRSFSFCLSAYFYSQSMSDRFSAHVRPVVQFYHVFKQKSTIREYYVNKIIQLFTHV